MFSGFEADLIQGRGGIPLGFANPALYRAAHTAAFHDVTGTPQGKGVTEADVLKYRLYAIDRIISRVISYAVVSAVLAGVFAGLVLLTTEVLPSGGAGDDRRCWALTAEHLW
jgi:hypothetical protein